MKLLKNIIPIFLLALIGACKEDDVPPDPPGPVEIRGADLSLLPEVRQSGLEFFNLAGQPEDMLLTLKNTGLNTVRLRLWKDPGSPVSGFESVSSLSREIKSAGMKTLLSVHYSDTWADPGRQTKPAAWENAGLAALHDSVYQYTLKILREIKPDFIQIGNEINNGFLWPEGSSTDLQQMKQLLETAIRAVRESGEPSRIIIHYAGYAGADAFFSGLSGLDYDLIGISYYPFWHGKDTALLRNSLGMLAEQTGKPVLIAETAYPFSLGWNDWTHNIIGLENQLLPGFSATPESQKEFLSMIRKMMLEIPGGAGFCYWGAEWVSYQGPEATNGSPWENQALWDFDRRALPVLQVFNNPAH